MLIRNGLSEPNWSFEVERLLCARNGAGGNMWTTCWWPVLLWLGHLRIRHDPAFWLIAGSSLRRAWFFVVTNDKKHCIWMMWDRGTRWFFNLSVMSTGRLRKFWNQRNELLPRKVARRRVFGELESSYLVDPASSHMLVSKIKPCMSKYKQVCTVKLRMAH
jgi:hypothetical protein